MYACKFVPNTKYNTTRCMVEELPFLASENRDTRTVCMKEKSLNFTKLSIWCDSVRLHDTLFSLEGICHTGPADISLSTQRLDGTQMLERLDLKWGATDCTLLVMFAQRQSLVMSTFPHKSHCLS